MAYTTVNKSSSFFNTVLYAGTNSGETISGVGFQPDLNWTKMRDGTEANQVVDSVRGVTKTMYTNDNSSEDTQATGLTAFNSDGYVHGTLNAYCQSGKDFVSWNWKAGTTSGLSGGTITPTSYSINTTSGFGIYKYTGTGSVGTIAHGLGTTPRVVITKGFDTASKSWCWGQADIGWTKELFINTTAAEGTTSGAWNDTDPTDTLITLGTGGNGNSSGVNYVMYAFAPISGYSKFSSYTGNGNADGAFVYTGFKPSWLVVKRSDSTGAWMLIDNKRLGYNDENRDFKINDTIAERDVDQADILSNGFKVRTTSSDWNTSGGTYIYMAFGQTLVGTNNIPSTAR